MEDVQPKLRPKEDRRSSWPMCDSLPWKTVEEVIEPLHTDNEVRMKARVKTRLLERWSHHPAVEAVLKAIELRKKMVELTDELLMSILQRLDRKLPLAEPKEEK